MEQKITSEKIKKLELKNSMLNFKIFSLMKKQLFSFMVLLAIIFFASGNVWAQYGTFTPAQNNNTQRYIMVAGSHHTFSATLSNSANAYAWTVWTNDGATNQTANTAVVSSSTPSLTGVVTSFAVNWARSAAGSYYVQLIETDAANAAGCATTTRRFYVTIIDFDIYVYASDENGLQLSTAAERTSCGNGTTVNYGNEGPGQAFNNTFNTNGDLIGYVGTNPRTTRYISFQIIWRITGTTGVTVPTVESMTFDYATHLNKVGGSGAYPENTDLISTNGHIAPNNATGVASLVDMETNANGPIASIANSTVAGEVGTIPIVVNDRWSHSTAIEDLALWLRATNINLYSADGAGGTHLGMEPTTYEAATTQVTAVQTASNNTADQIIQLAPATGTIGVAQN